jgi:glutathione synthase/RimK-type ligase-like ATP-grasp enzyme
MRIAILRFDQLPLLDAIAEIPPIDVLLADEHLLVDQFAALGAQAEFVVWNDPSADWEGYDVALLRCTWDYIDHRDQFLGVMAAIDASSCRLFNPLDAVRWNSDKSYLFDLQQWGVPIVPTYAAAVSNLPQLQAALAGSPTAVLKPRIGAGASGVRLVPTADLAAALQQLAAAPTPRDYFVQPLIDSVRDEGEWSYIYVDGQLSHVLRKTPAPGDFRAHAIYGGAVTLETPGPADLAQVEAMRARLPFDLLYGRFDLVRREGQLAIMELELIEPMLYFPLAPHAAATLAAAALARLTP